MLWLKGDKLEIVVKDCGTTRGKFAFFKRELRGQKEHQIAMEQLLRSVNESLDRLGQVQQTQEKVHIHVYEQDFEQGASS